MISSVLTKVAPKVINVAGYAVNGVIEGIKANGLAGYRMQLDGYEVARLPGERVNLGDEQIISAESGNQEQYLHGLVGYLTEDVVKGFVIQREMQNSTLYSILVNCKREDLVLETNSTFIYKMNATPGETKNGIPVIGLDDHAYLHLVPKLFKNYDKLKQHLCFILNHIEIESTQMTNEVTGTTLSFFPVSFDTRKYTNSSIKSAYNSQSTIANNTIKYIIRNASPALYINENGTFRPKDFVIHPNFCMYSSYLDLYEKSDIDSDGEFLSYGTLCFVKENFNPDKEVAMQFSVKMFFDVYDQMSVIDKIDDGDSDGGDGGDGDGDGGDGDGSGSVKPTGSSKPTESISLGIENNEPTNHYPLTNCIKRKTKLLKK